MEDAEAINFILWFQNTAEPVSFGIIKKLVEAPPVIVRAMEHPHCLYTMKNDYTDELSPRITMNNHHSEQISTV